MKTYTSCFIWKYSDLIQILHDLNVKSGVRIDYGVEIVDVNLEKPYVTLESGEQICGDIVVGADGPRSIVRRKMDGAEIREGPYTGHT